MTDRELLELAAKAAGYNIDHPWNRDRMNMSPPVVSLVAHDSNGDLVNTAWNPLTDDGDALRLAVKLELFDKPEWITYRNLKFAAETCGSSESVRYGFVRAAAEIGKSLP